MLALIAVAVVVVVVDLLIQRWAGKRDRMFRPLSIGRDPRLIKQRHLEDGNSPAAGGGRYLRLRGPCTSQPGEARRAGGYPAISGADFAQLLSLAVRLDVLPAAAAAPAEAPAPAASVAPAVPEPAKAPSADSPADGA